MKILLIGGGGREHAIAYKLAQSPMAERIYCAPGNAGTAGTRLCENVDIPAEDVSGLLGFALDNGVDFAVVGPDDPLALGIADAFEAAGLKIFGPIKKAARLEWSKAFAKDFMKKHGIPTAAYDCFGGFEEALAHVRAGKFPVVIKADGLALGKGVVICQTLAEAENTLADFMLNQRFGQSGKTVVIEEFLEGPEITVLAFCDGETVVPMASSRDFKKAFDGDLGPNTGGMGAVSPSPAYTPEIERECLEKIFRPTLAALKAEGIDYRGVIYFGLISAKDGVKVIEYNSRFGDPEAQALLLRLESDLLEIMLACAEKRLGEISLKWREDAASACVVLVSGGYPGDYEKGREISGLDGLGPDITAFHAGTARAGDKLITSGGRVVGLCALGETAAGASEKVYAAARKIGFKNMRFRSDII